MENILKKKLTIALKILLLISVTSYVSFGQIPFNDVYGKKENYKISIPEDYSRKEAVGANVDLKFVNNQGYSIVTVVKTGPAGLKSSDIEFMANASDYDVKKGLEATGLSNITILNKGLIEINDYPSGFIYYTDGDLYFHAITQFRKGKVINLTFTCTLSERNSNMAYIYKVINSLKWLK